MLEGLVAVDSACLWANQGRAIAHRALGWQPDVLGRLIEDLQHHLQGCLALLRGHVVVCHRPDPAPAQPEMANQSCYNLPHDATG